MKVLVIYDISHPRRIQRVSKILLDYGIRVQKSIFELDVTSKQLAKIKKEVEIEIEEEEDGVKYFPLCSACSGKMLALGVGANTSIKDFTWQVI